MWARMTPRTDGLERLTEAQICELAGTSQQRRQTWVRRGVLPRSSGDGCGLRDALELAQLLRLVEVVGPTDGLVAWDQLREELAKPFAIDPLDVVFDTQLKRAVLVRAGEEMRPAVAHGRPVRVVPLAALRAEVSEAFRRLAQVAGKRAGGKTRARVAPARRSS